MTMRKNEKTTTSPGQTARVVVQTGNSRVDRDDSPEDVTLPTCRTCGVDPAEEFEERRRFGLLHAFKRATRAFVETVTEITETKVHDERLLEAQIRREQPRRV